jgi:type II secretory pathway component GspD/PulD (secretin)
MIEAMVIDVSKDGRKNLGLDWGWTYNGKTTPGAVESGTLVMQALGADIGYIPAGGLNEFILKVRATCEKGEARVEANPRLATLDGQTAEIFIGRDSYYNLTTSTDTSTTTRLESIKTGITLKLLPQVADNGDITVRIEPEVSDVVADGNGNGNLPVISRRKVSTTVRVKTGESIVLGGLLQRASHKIKTKVPILGDLPILSALFSSTKTVQEEGEVLIIITPYLMDGPDAGRTPKLAAPAQAK